MKFSDIRATKFQIFLTFHVPERLMSEQQYLTAICGAFKTFDEKRG